MRLPWGTLGSIGPLFIRDSETILLGCLSFEERACAVPEALKSSRVMTLIEVIDPPEAFPDHSAEILRRTEKRRERLLNAGVKFQACKGDLVVTENKLLGILRDFLAEIRPESVAILDITSLPKRYFCFLLKRMVIQDTLRNLIVTYTEPGDGGYTSGHLADDPMTPEHLPGYAAPPPTGETTFAISVGFESLSIKPLLENFGGDKKKMRMLFAFPPNGENTKRQWSALRRIITDTQEVMGNTEVVAAWDTEQVYRTLKRWRSDCDGLTLVPFGPKPHSLGMALFALRYDSGLYYTQPQSYDPDYSSGQGKSWAYIVKWDGVPCYKRYVNRP